MIVSNLHLMKKSVNKKHKNKTIGNLFLNLYHVAFTLHLTVCHIYKKIKKKY